MSRKPRILFVMTLPPPVHGSAVISQQIKESHIIQEAFESDYVNLSTSRKINEIGRFSLSKAWRIVCSFSLLFWKLITKHFDLCYISLTCHGRGFLKDAPFALLCKLFCQRLVIHQHNKGMAKDVDRWPYRWLLPWVYKNANVVLLSWRLYPDIEKIVPKENVMICPNGIKVADSGRKVHKENNIPRLLFLSNLIESKGVFILLNALKILADKGFLFRCTFVGGESKEIDAERFAEEVNQRQLTGLVTYRGRKYGDEKEEAFMESDVFVFPTMEDCFPLVLLEAMEFRLPIVTTTEGAIPDEVTDGENGLICERNNSESLADCIGRLLDNAVLREQMGEAGYNILVTHFTSDHFESRMKCILEDLCITNS